MFKILEYRGHLGIIKYFESSFITISDSLIIDLLLMLLVDI